MKRHRRVPALLLTASMSLSMLTPAWAVEAKPKSTAVGGMQAALRIDYSQSLQELEKRNIQAELFRGNNSLGTVDMTDTGAVKLGEYTAQVAMRDRLGGERTGSALPGALDLSVSGLPQGTYTLRFTGEGYAACSTEFTIQDYNQYVEVGTGDNTFALGDFDKSGKVDTKDRDALAAVLGSTRTEDLKKYDLNGDGKIDIVDLAYVNHNANTSGVQPTVLDTSCFNVQLSSDASSALSSAGTVVKGGELDSLLQEDGTAVTFQNSSGKGDIAIPIPLSGTVEAENLQIVTPDGVAGSIQSGTVEVEYEGGSPLRYSFDNTAPEGLHAITRTPGSSVITISLGRRVPVKKVTITVTKSEGGQYAAVETIRFLKDIVPENLTQPNTEVKNLTAEAKDGLVNLKWRALPNVSGYRVEYWLKDGDESTRRTLNVDVPQAQVTGLENLKTYLFTVTPVDGSWQGSTCAPVEATPQPAKVPPAPDMVNVTALDGQLKLSWKKGENAVWYEVYYTSKANANTSEYQQVGGRLTEPQLTISGLTNDTTYYLYVVAGNEVGKSGPSRIYSGTPKSTDFSRPEGIPTKGILDNSKIASIVLGDPGNYHAPAYSAGALFNPQYMIDGDYRTHWTASTNYTRNEHVILTFKEPVDLTAAFWVPRLDGRYSSYLRAYSVRVWYSGEEDGEGHLLTGGVDNGGGSNAEVWTWPNIPNKNNIPTDRFAVLPFGPVSNVSKISIAVEQEGYNQVSLSELMFMEYDPEHCLPDDIAALFSDELCTELAPGVTQEQIDALKVRLSSGERFYYLNVTALDDELVLAQELLDGKPTSGVVLRGVQSRSSAADGAKYGQGGSDLQPLGVAAKAGSKITVYASGIPEGETVSVKASQFNAEASTWLSGMGTLVNGRNVLTVPKIGAQDTERGGSLYFTYSGSSPESIRLHVRQAVDIPALELSDWYTLENSVRKERIGAYVEELTAYVSKQGITDANKLAKSLNVTEISMPSVLLSIPAAAVLNANGLTQEEKVENLYQNVLAWEDIMHICKTTQGIDKTYAENDMTSRQNIRCMQMFAGAFMYAAGNHIGIGYGSCGGMVSGQPISALGSGANANQLFGWGIAHEIGHNMDKLGRAEITNNLYSLMVQTYDGEENLFPSRLELSGKYPAIFTKTAQGWAGESNNVFVQLGMYWQLHLAYDGGDKPMDFYNRFFKSWKSGEYTGGMSGLSYDEKVALTASGTANANLTEFFTRWGMTLSDEVKEKLSAYPAESRAIWYLSDQSRRDRLSGASAAGGTVSASAKLENENTILVSIEASLTQGTLQGFEIVRNGTPVGFVIPEEDGSGVYEDVIGSGNHRTYTYQVLAYDMLGNQLGGTAEAGEIRVAYDKTVDASAYDITREKDPETGADTVTITLKEVTSVSGLKLSKSNLPDSGAYTVKVTAEFGEEGELVTREVEARSGSFDQGNQAVDDQNSYLTYFQKPGVGQDDTRIWTYDAKVITITGVPEAVTNEEIRLVSYAGDDVAFLEGGTVGRLLEDYRYGDGDEDVIAKGTLIIAGTYRGDPRFNIVKIMGRFTETTDEGEVKTVEREFAGESILFAEIPEDNAVSDISDGLFIFVPDVQSEAELQEVSQCDGVNLLPSEMKAVLSRTDLPDSADSQRVTAETLWIGTPGGTDLPAIKLED